MDPILQVDRLSISFSQYTRGAARRDLPVIRDLSFSLPAGQVTAVVGASGSGKSLLAHAILGLLPYNSRAEGEILYRGAPLTPERAVALRGREIALVPQGITYLDPLMKIGPQVRRGDRSPEARARSRAALGRYGLGPEVEDLYPFELSGGMARRVLIASAVAGHPRLIVADEPTPGLDARAAGRILGHFRELAEEGAAVLFITHDLELALTIARRVLVLYAGETVEEADADDFAAGRLRHPYTRALWAALPQNGFTPIPGAQPCPGEFAAGCQFAPRCPRRRPECAQRPVPYAPFRGGMARCLRPEEGGT